VDTVNGSSSTNPKNGDIHLVIFDMDDTLLQGRTISVFADKLGFTEELYDIIYTIPTSIGRSKKIAQLLVGYNEEELLRLFKEIPLQEHLEEVIHEIHHRRLHTALVTNSYSFVAKILQQQLGLEFVFANNLIIHNGIVTGEYHPHNTKPQERFEGCKCHPICKRDVLDHLCEQLNLVPRQVMAVGDGVIDICMLQRAGIGVAYRAPREVQQYADVCVTDMRELLPYL